MYGLLSSLRFNNLPVEIQGQVTIKKTESEDFGHEVFSHFIWKWWAVN